jgi:hypothetical protein
VSDEDTIGFVDDVCKASIIEQIERVSKLLSYMSGVLKTSDTRKPCAVLPSKRIENEEGFKNLVLLNADLTGNAYESANDEISVWLRVY